VGGTLQKSWAGEYFQKVCTPAIRPFELKLDEASILVEHALSAHRANQTKSVALVSKQLKNADVHFGAQWLKIRTAGLMALG